MSISRRQILKALGVSPFLGLQIPGLNSIETAEATSCTCTNILLHGLFFLEFQGSVLFAVAPKVTNHLYYLRDQGQKSPTRISGVIDLLSLNATKVTAADKFPGEMLQFSKKAIGHRGNFIDATALSKYELVLKLPIPNCIVPFRSGKFADFQPTAGKKVTESIRKNHSAVANVPVIISLQYDKEKPPYTRNFYAEHPNSLVPVRMVNDAFKEAANAFGNSFDLQLDNIPSGKVMCDSQLPDEITVDDEIALPDLLNNKTCNNLVPTDAAQRADQFATSVQVATCPQFGVNP